MKIFSAGELVSREGLGRAGSKALPINELYCYGVQIEPQNVKS